MDIVHNRWFTRLAAGAFLTAVCLCGTIVRAQELPTGPVSFAGGRVTVGADVSLSTSTEHDDPSDPTHSAWFNYTDYEHNTMRLARIGATADVRVAERVSVLAEIRSENGDRLLPYALFVRVRPLKS